MEKETHPNRNAPFIKKKAGQKQAIPAIVRKMSYPFRQIEARWQRHWEKKKTFRTPDDHDKPKYYVLDMFPYPSGAGLHVGHPEGYTATDIVARVKRMQGYNVLHPMGWDAFGLPAERHAMQTGIHPARTTENNINNFRGQLKRLGFSYDWDREINTTDPDYYCWTQWIFLKIFNSFYDEKENRARPIEELEIPPEIRRSKKKREGYINDRRLAYIANIPVNWCSGLGTVLANEEVDEWVEKGYTVEQRPMRQWMLRITAYAERLLDDLQYVEWPAGTLELQKNWIGRSDGADAHFPLLDDAGKRTGEVLTIFTTRPDTLYGVTYMVLAPEHPAVNTLITPERKTEVEAYVRATAHKSELDRKMMGEKDSKTGVFTGGYVEHPLTKEKVPVWIADYVLLGYGTGAIMAVPAHDERDFAFAHTFGLPIRFVVRPADATNDDWRKEGAFTAEGINFNSDIINDLPTPQAIERMIEHLEKNGLGERQINYRLRDWLFSRQRYWGEPIPISFDEKGGMVAADEKKLPLLLPECDDFQPADTGESPLANLKRWVRFKKDGKTFRRETNTMPQWAGSCWYYLRFISPGFSNHLVDRDEEKYWMGKNGVDLYVGGAEHAVLHLLYARFWHKVLFDLGLVSTVEPFRKLIHQGLIIGEDSRKMSKSMGNVVNPDDVVKRYGADAFRLFEMFMGPLEQMKPWSSQGIEGVFRFLYRVWRLYTGSEEGDPEQEEKNVAIDPLLLTEPTEEEQRKVKRLLHQTIKKVSEDVERLAFNTAISQMMIFVNEFFTSKKIGEEAARAFILLLSPFAPHLAEELWRLLGNGESLSHEPWPRFDPALTVEDEIEIVFQVNGKIRGRAKLPPDSSEAILKESALRDEGVLRALEGREVRRVIVVKNKLVNVVG